MYAAVEDDHDADELAIAALPYHDRELLADLLAILRRIPLDCAPDESPYSLAYRAWQLIDLLGHDRRISGR